MSRSPDALAQLGRVVSIVDIALPQNLVQAWGKNASYHFVFTRQNRGKLDELSALIERGQLRPHVARCTRWLILLSPMPCWRAQTTGSGAKSRLRSSHRLISLARRFNLDFIPREHLMVYEIALLPVSVWGPSSRQMRIYIPTRGRGR